MKYTELKSGELFRFYNGKNLYIKLHSYCISCTNWRMMLPRQARDHNPEVVSCGMVLTNNNHLDLMICLKQLVGILEFRCKAEGGEGLTAPVLNEARKQIEIGKNYLSAEQLKSSYWSS